MGTVGRRWSRQVRDVKTGIIYENVEEAAKAFGVTRATIYRRLNREHKFKYNEDINVMWVN